MSIKTTINLIQTVNATISGVTKCPQLSAYPIKADTADLPLVLTLPAEGSFDHEGIGGGKKRQDRTYRIVVFVEPSGQNEFPKRAELSATLLQAFINRWLTVDDNGYPVALADPVNDGDPQVTVQASIGSPHTDSGIRPDLTIGGVLYHGFTIDLRVREIW